MASSTGGRQPMEDPTPIDLDMLEGLGQQQELNIVPSTSPAMELDQDASGCHTGLGKARTRSPIPT
eukprot:7792362-Prorocentrum_lima.AAC.1